MQYRQLGKTEIKVSLLCLGSMTFGKQNTQADAHQQLDYASAQGINFIDTAEMYAIPPTKETYGSTETYIGNWLQNQQRDSIILASKVVGPCAEWQPHVRNGKTRLDKYNIETALHDSLKRLKTDYIDLYQLHWPDRKTNFFGSLGYTHHADEQCIPLQETLSVLADLIKSGKIRAIGLSNETPWGAMKYIELAKQQNLPLMVSIQNPYNLLNRSFEIGLAEIAMREQLGLLAYSPLGFGVLSGKYLNQQKPNKSRLTLFRDYLRYSSDNAIAATAAYTALANQHQLNPAQMALAYINHQAFLTSTIIGATTMPQLKENIASIALTLSSEVLQAIDKIHQRYPNPSP